MSDDRKQTWSDTYNMLTKGSKCLSGVRSSSEWNRCLNLPDNASDADRAKCQKFFQNTYQDCMKAYDAYQGSGGSGVKPPPKPPKK